MGCQTDYEKKYVDKWEDSEEEQALKFQCDIQEETICGATNHIAKKGFGKMTSSQRESLNRKMEESMRDCKKFITENEKCKAECDKLLFSSGSKPSSASSLTTTVFFLSALAFIFK